MDLPGRTTEEDAAVVFEAREGFFDYEPCVLVPEPRVEWHVNFADPHLFCAYGGPLLAQDEMQVAEHPALASLREALLHHRLRPLTVENGRPTPVLVAGVERRCRIATEPSAALGRPAGLYGNNFARADAETVRKATHRIDPPTRSNIIAMAAPAYGHGRYSRAEIECVLQTAFTGFRAARLESRALAGNEARAVVHTGFWGCGAFGGNRVLMTLLQLIAARLAGVDRLVFHTGDPSGLRSFHEASAILGAEIWPREACPRVGAMVEGIEAMGFEWGVSDGN